MKQTEQTTNKKICESCGVNFDCGANTEKCWCFDVYLSKETLAKLREDFNNCLCPKCLSTTDNLHEQAVMH